MKKKNLLFVFGTRPEAIKMAPLVLRAKSLQLFDVKVCVTGQHRAMLDQVLRFFEIKPDFDLNLMRPDQTLNSVVAGVSQGLDEILSLHSFDTLLVHGDTTTTMMASLAAFHRKVPVAHVEAGLRTHNIYSPWPEEMNRRVAGMVARWHFAPTQKSKENLLKEGVAESSVFVTGNSVIDALHLVVERIEKDATLHRSLEDKFSYLDASKPLILVTGHRRENFGDQFIDLCQGLKKLALSHEIQIVYPVHLNPHVQRPVNQVLSGVPNVFLIDPLDYVPFVYLMKRSHLIITDSGGVQEEAPSLDKPVLVMRETTERPEAVEAGTVRLVGPKGDKIFSEASRLLQDSLEYKKMRGARNPYGDGQTSQRIMEILTHEI